MKNIAINPRVNWENRRFHHPFQVEGRQNGKNGLFGKVLDLECTQGFLIAPTPAMTPGPAIQGDPS
jgi:hypothetical protein